MTPLDQIAPAFIGMAHSIVWASVATVDASLDDLRGGSVVTVAKSRKQPDVLVACGAIE